MTLPCPLPIFFSKLRKFIFNFLGRMQVCRRGSRNKKCPRTSAGGSAKKKWPQGRVHAAADVRYVHVNVKFQFCYKKKKLF